MLEGLKPLKQLFNPRIGPAAKPSEVTLKPLEAWEYLLSLVKQYYDPTALPGKPRYSLCWPGLEVEVAAFIAATPIQTFHPSRGV